MEKQDLLNYKSKLQNLSKEEKINRDLYLRKIATGEIMGPPTGYPSIDKTWLKYYKEEYITAEIPYMTITEYFEKSNADNMEAIALEGEDGTYTYQEVKDTYEIMASSLYKLTEKKGDISLFVLPPMAIEPILFFAANKSGTAITGLPPQATTEDIINAINNFNCKVLFIHESLLFDNRENEIYEKTNLKTIVLCNPEKLNNHSEKTLSKEEFLTIGKESSLPEIDVKPEDLVFISQTGGSTGAPKSVMLNSNNFNISAHEFINSDLDYNRNDIWLRLWPLFSASAAISNSHLPLCVGTHMRIESFPEKLEDFAKIIVDTKANHLVLIPQLLDALENHELLKNRDLSYVKSAGCGGMSITEEFETRTQEFFKIHNILTFLGYAWGCTENSRAAAMRSNFETTKFGTVGAPLVKTTVTVFDAREEYNFVEKGYDEEGELCISSETIMMGYYNNPEATNEVIKKHPDGSIWLHTKDLGSINKEGLIKVTGRMTRSIFVFPTAKIYPTALENQIAKIPGVNQVAICKIPDKEHNGFYLPVYFIIPEQNQNPETLKNYIYTACKNFLPSYAQPSEIYIQEQLPLTPVGKPDILTLEKELLEQMTLSLKKKAD